MLSGLINLDVCQIKRAYCARFFLWLARMPDMTLFQKILIFYAVMAVISSLITWFLTHDKKRIRFLSAFLVGATWPISFPVALLFSLF
ncbi:GhoT/OrtT family toxin [Salmonella enterica]|uniref:GhoT/OrtT family toxin n=1 Tax=Salmonella enterica subsp. enterica serovar Adelaide TaxID=29473 RepID=A0A5Z9V9E4_SALET|nr:GhoT/OrtT family toxin [Salmonella enterica subsp. enterica]EAA8168548.1 GhoT/OrtT family toxin [Salmonella enterica]EAM3826181.1 GhoT/OrtT family toxin [Salmonella enterica subsp. enterica serovar Adelaide]EBH8622854.1 GhoT/OrtT family toxin [Salmonella enterica subsp. enterica serovar Tees]ECV3494465.1 GhoT/OrtT family toxin [Salmonella enterica subsp. enterica serovar Derby]